LLRVREIEGGTWYHVIDLNLSSHEVRPRHTGFEGRLQMRPHCRSVRVEQLQHVGPACDTRQSHFATGAISTQGQEPEVGISPISLPDLGGLPLHDAFIVVGLLLTGLRTILGPLCVDLQLFDSKPLLVISLLLVIVYQALCGKAGLALAFKPPIPSWVEGRERLNQLAFAA
jgi:hypothetical protein